MINENGKLLELAAKAAGFLNWTSVGPSLFVETGHSRGNTGYHWNPLIDDGDAHRLAVKLGLRFECRKDGQVYVWLDSVLIWNEFALNENNEEEKFAAVRRAIVCAAAEIGKQLPIEETVMDENQLETAIEVAFEQWTRNQTLEWISIRYAFESGFRMGVAAGEAADEGWAGMC